MSRDQATRSAARLREVFFSYDRDATFPDQREVDPVPDPDARGGIVLNGVDLDLPRDSVTVVMGASGGGKSTLVRTLNAIIPSFIRGSFRGQVDVLGRDATTMRTSEMAHTVGMVLQDYEAQIFGTSIEAEVAFGPENLAVSPAEITGRIEEALTLVELDSLDRHRGPAGLSGGQKQRLVLAGVLAMHPDLLVLDEPTSDLDPRGSQDLLAAMTSLVDGETELGAPETIVLVTHQIEEAVLADRAVLLRGGQVYREGPLYEVFTDVEALRACRVAVPPMVDIFNQLSWNTDNLPLVPEEGVALLEDRDFDWKPPARTGDPLPGVPAKTGETVGDVLFELQDVSYAYRTDRGPQRAIDQIDLTINEGEVLAIVGHNGSGKTTLAKQLNGLLTPDTGSVRWRGQEVSDLSMSKIGQHVGYLFQNPDHQLFAATVEEEVAFGPENFGIEGDELNRRTGEAIAAVELEPLKDADPFNLSKGQRQRVALASVLATDPDAIIFDEPTTGLDAIQQRQFLDMVAGLNRDEGLTVIMVTHDMDTVGQYAPRTVVLEDGKLVADEPTRELFANSLEQWGLRSPHVVEFSNQIGDEEDLPALSVEEVVHGLGGAQPRQDIGERS